MDPHGNVLLDTKWDYKFLGKIYILLEMDYFPKRALNAFIKYTLGAPRWVKNEWTEGGQPSRFHPSAAWKSNSAGLTPEPFVFPGFSQEAPLELGKQLFCSSSGHAERAAQGSLGQSLLLFLAVGFGNFLCERCQDWEALKDQNAKLLLTLLRYKLHRWMFPTSLGGREQTSGKLWQKWQAATGICVLICSFKVLFCLLIFFS